MKKLNKKIYASIGSVLVVALIVLCLFCSVQNKQDYETPGDKSMTPIVSSVIASNTVETLNPSVTKTDFVDTNAKNDSNSFDNNNNVTESKVEVLKDNVIKHEELWTEGFELPYNVNSISDPGVTVYYQYNPIDNGYKLSISGTGGAGWKSFDSAEAAPWVNPTDKSAPKQEDIIEVEILANDGHNVTPTNTIGWFGCQTDNRPYAHLSRINKISGLDNLDMSNVKNASFMFCGSNQIESADATDTFFSNIKQVDNAFGICNYTNLSNDFLNKIAQAICSTATDVSWAFANNKDNLISFTIDDNNSKVENACYMFYMDKCLETVTADKLISSKVTSVDRMFYYCAALMTISLNSFTNWYSISASDKEMFKYCWRLVGANKTAYANVKIMDKSYAKTDVEGNPGYFSWKPGTEAKPLHVDGYKYYPVAGNSLSHNIKFYDSNYNELLKTGADGKYRQSDLAGKKDGNVFCATYYAGEGSFTAVRSINYINYNTVYGIGGTGAKSVDLEWKIKNLVHDDEAYFETVERLVDQNGNPETLPTIDGVDLKNICDVYNPMFIHSRGDPWGFGGDGGRFWSCVAKNELNAWFFFAPYYSLLEWDRDDDDINACVCVSRVFNVLKVNANVDVKEHGSISIKGGPLVEYGTPYTINDKTITIGTGTSAKTIKYSDGGGYTLDKWMIGDVDAPASGIVTSDLTFTAKTQKGLYTVAAKVDVGGHGSITGSPETVVGCETYKIEGKTITIGTGTSPKSITYSNGGGYTLDKWMIGDVDAPASGIVTSDIMFTAKTKVNKWKAMQAESGDPQYPLINFYPAFSDPAMIAGYAFSVDGGSTDFYPSSMSDIYNKVKDTSDKTLYYEKIDDDANPLECYAVKDMSWNSVFVDGGDYEEAADYQEDFITNYIDKGIWTAEFGDSIISDLYGENWNATEEGSPVNYPNIRQGWSLYIPYYDFYKSYGGNDGGLLSWGSNYPWGSCTASGWYAFEFQVDSGKWSNQSYDFENNSIVLARTFD